MELDVALGQLENVWQGMTGDGHGEVPECNICSWIINTQWPEIMKRQKLGSSPAPMAHRTMWQIKYSVLNHLNICYQKKQLTLQTLFTHISNSMYKSFNRDSTLNMLK